MLLEDRILKKWLLPFILSVLIAVDSMAQCIPVYKDSSMSVERRVTDLLGRMTLREKIAQLSHLHGYQLYNGQEVQLVILVTAVLRDSILLVKMCGKHFMQFRNIWLKRHAWESQFLQ